MIIPNHPKTRVALIITSSIIVLGIIFLLTALAVDLWTIPYLSPLAHFLFWIIQPLIPFLAPVTLGVFIKICRSKEMKELGLRKGWAFISGSQILQHVERVWRETRGLWIRGDCGKGVVGGWCAAGNCWRGWVQLGVFGWVLGGEVVGWRWEGGAVERWIVRLCEEERRNRALKAADELEKGGEVRDEEMVLSEKAVLSDQS